MRAVTVSIRYAKALFETAEEMKITKAVADDMLTLSQSISSSKELKVFTVSPIIKLEVKLTILTELFKDKVSDITFKFIKLLLENGRLNLLQNISDEYLKLYYSSANLLNVKVKSYVGFNEQQSEQLKNKFEMLTGKTVTLDVSTDTNLLGGFVAQVEDTVYDASIKRKLENMKKALLEA